MDLSSISTESISAAQMATTQQAAGMLLIRKVLDMEAAQGAMLIQMLNQSAGLGRNLDTQA